MKVRKKYLLFAGLLLFSKVVSAQDDLMKMLEQETRKNEETIFTLATFKTTRIVNGHSTELNQAGVLQFLVGHRFGTLKSGPYELFGLDNATMRLGLEYGISDRINVGIGRSTMEKTVDAFAKYKLLEQSTGKRFMPVSLVLFANAAAFGLRSQPGQDRDFTSRLSYSYQALIARKFNENFSFQLSPTLIHRNLVDKKTDKNDIFALGGGMRHKITKRVTINGEYYYVFPDQLDRNFHNSLSFGFDIETGGHVFQLHCTNSKGMVESLFIPNTTSNWLDGGIFFGFNISRVFTIKNYDETKKRSPW